MPKAAQGQKFYAVQKGRQTGVFLSWAECEEQTKGYLGAKFKSFKNAAEAEAFVTGIPTTASRSSSSSPAASSSKGHKRTMTELADESKYDVVYTDGACKGNGQLGAIAGIGVWWGENDPRNLAERCPGDQTNNRAELIAIVRLLESTPKCKKPLLIKTDSQYSIKCFNKWMPNWLKNNFRNAEGKPVKNARIIKYISALLKSRGLMGQEVRLEYVKGHSGDRGNDGADAQANIGATLPEVPERDWEEAEKEVTEQAEKEYTLSTEKPAPVPLLVVAGELAGALDSPRKAKKIEHEVPFSRLSSASPSRSPKQPLTRNISPDTSTNRRAPSPSSPLAPVVVVDLSSSPKDTKDTLLAEGKPVPFFKRTPMPDGQKLQNDEPPSPKTHIRRHGVGLFSMTPPPNAGLAKKILPEPQMSKESPKNVVSTSSKVMAMAVDVADVNFEDYLDCVDDVSFDDI